MTLRRVIIVCGHYGVGKSECSVALAQLLRDDEPNRPITLIDLDVVNPYFRSREARAVLEGCSIEVIGNSLGIDSGVDLPAIPGTITPVLRDQSKLVIIDLGGDPAGARALRQFREVLSETDTEVLYVVNTYRPQTRTVSDIVAMGRAIAAEIELEPTGMISNSHLLHETTCVEVTRGVNLCTEAGLALGIPIAMTAARAEVIASCPRAVAGRHLPILGDLRSGWMNADAMPATQTRPDAPTASGSPSTGRS